MAWTGLSHNAGSQTTFQRSQELIDGRELVELSGIEPLASSLRTRRSPS
jgi:hypothetical protein